MVISGLKSGTFGDLEMLEREVEVSLVATDVDGSSRFEGENEVGFLLGEEGGRDEVVVTRRHGLQLQDCKPGSVTTDSPQISLFLTTEYYTFLLNM